MEPPELRKAAVAWLGAKTVPTPFSLFLELAIFDLVNSALEQWDSSRINAQTQPEEGRTEKDRELFRLEADSGLRNWILPARENQRYGLQLEISYFLEEHANWTAANLDTLVKRLGDELCVYLIGKRFEHFSVAAGTASISDAESDADEKFWGTVFTRCIRKKILPCFKHRFPRIWRVPNAWETIGDGCIELIMKAQGRNFRFWNIPKTLSWLQRTCRPAIEISAPIDGVPIEKAFDWEVDAGEKECDEGGRPPNPRKDSPEIAEESIELESELIDWQRQLSTTAKWLRIRRVLSTDADRIVALRYWCLEASRNPPGWPSCFLKAYLVGSEKDYWPPYPWKAIAQILNGDGYRRKDGKFVTIRDLFAEIEMPPEYTAEAAVAEFDRWRQDLKNGGTQFSDFQLRQFHCLVSRVLRRQPPGAGELADDTEG